MNKIIPKLVLPLVLLMSAFGMNANPVDLRTAKEVAVKFMNANVKTPLRGTDDLQFVTTYNTSLGDVAFYVFNTSNGFVIVSADDCAMPILGYSDEGTFDVENIPIQLQDYLQGFVEQIQYGIENHVQDETTSQQWEMVRSVGHLIDQRGTTAVAPLLTDSWDQGCYYNAKCPEDPNGYCGHVLTGCVATSFAQIMHYWGYPAKGMGSNNYTPPGYPEQMVNFSATTYDWDNMPNSLTSSSTTTEINAVATLMWHCGVAVYMQYGRSDSGASPYPVSTALVNYFGYSNELSFEYRSNYSDEDWLDLMKGCLDLGRPIHYSGWNPNGGGGHSFVCDGYNANNLLHFNWGWSGGCNGYYSINAMNPDIYVYTNGHMAIINIHPPECTSGTTYQITASTDPSNGGTVSGAGTYDCGDICSLTATANEGYAFDKWTKDGEDFSYFSTLNVTVTEAAEYVACFEPMDGIVIGDATYTNNYLPAYYYNSMTQQIYTASEMGGASTEISSVSFFNTYDRGGTRKWNVYMVNTDKTSFESNSDWIPVSESDLVFSGNITMTAQKWTTVYFNTPFLYDGSSNVALVVDNNSNSHDTSIKCRTFVTEDNQAIRIHGDYGSDYDPYNPSSYTGTLTAMKNHVVFGIPSYDYTVTAAVGPEGGGTVSGGGLCYLNQPITLTAVPDEGYVFSHWTRNGTVVSCLTTHQLTVTASEEYVAHFELKEGIVIGDATSASSYLPAYNNNSLSEQIYTVNEMGGMAAEIVSVSLFNTEFNYNITRNWDVYLVHTEKTSFTNTSDWIPVSENDLVFSGNVTITSRGWTTIILSTPFLYDGSSNVALVVDGNSNSYNSSIKCRTFATEESQAIRISGSSGTDYDPINPSGYTGVLMTEKNQIIFHHSQTVTVSANPVEGGVVSGGGIYPYGMSCTLMAMPNAGYYFLNWTEDGEVVSYDAAYSFAVNSDRNLVANFVEGESTCTIVFDLHDSYHNGWSGNYLVVNYSDGSYEQFTLESDSSVSYSREIATGSTIALSWIEGTNVNQCSFDIKFDNGVPIYHGSSLNANFQHELYVNCAVATAPHTITVVADPVEGGTVEGAGTYDGGTVITLTAMPNAGYSFIHWKENGTTVSSNANYSFTVTSDRNLLAFFSLPLTISVTTNMAAGGTTTGAGTYEYGNTCTLTATPNEGYLFLNWSKNGEVVSCNATYSFAVTKDAEIEAVFMLLEGTLIGQGESTYMYLPSYSNYKYTLSQQIYTPNEIGAAGSITSISYYNAGDTKTRNYDIYMVHTDKTAFNNNTDWIPVTEVDRVFRGNVVMTKGYWTTIVLDTPFAYNGTSNLAIVFDDNTGTYSYGMDCRVFYNQDYQAIRVYSDYTNYDPYNPSEYNGNRLSVKNQIILGITSSTQMLDLTAGWNWISTYVNTNDVDALTMLEEALGDYGVTIATADDVAEYLGDGFWLGLEGYQWTNSEMLMVEVNADCTVSLEGPAVDPSTVSITINPGWNWIGFPVDSEMSIVDALANFEPEYGDGIASYEGITEYIGIWTGDFDTLVPGQGYMYYSASATPKTLVFSTGTK